MGRIYFEATPSLLAEISESGAPSDWVGHDWCHVPRQPQLSRMTASCDVHCEVSFVRMLSIMSVLSSTLRSLADRSVDRFENISART